MRVIRVGTLAEEPLSAAAEFHQAMLPQIGNPIEAALLLVFTPADHTHRAWRLGVVQGLARRLAPCRINAIASDDEAAIAAAAAYLALAEGVTGQYLPLTVSDSRQAITPDSQGAGEMVP
jgi:hypothetical protein